MSLRSNITREPENQFRPNYTLQNTPPRPKITQQEIGDDSGYIPSNSSLFQSNINEEASGSTEPEQKVDINTMAHATPPADPIGPQNNVSGDNGPPSPSFIGPFPPPPPIRNVQMGKNNQVANNAGAIPRNNIQPAPPVQQINLPNHNQLVSLKDALRCVPEFKGEPGTFRLFQEGCEEARAMIDNNAEGNFVRLLRSKITEEARRSMKGQNFNTINELINYLKNIYSSTKPLLQLYGDLAQLYQKPDETVVTYVNRIREAIYRMIEAFTSETAPTEIQLRNFKEN